MSQTQLPDDMPITQTLTVQQWSLILSGLGELQGKFSFRLMQDIIANIEAAAAPPPHRMMRGNGADHDEPEPVKREANELPRSMR